MLEPLLQVSEDPLIPSKSNQYRLWDKHIRALILLLCTFVFVCDAMASACASFFPQTAASEFGLSPTVVGIIFAAYPASTVVVSPVSALISRRYGRLYPILGGLLVLSGAMVMFALSNQAWGFILSRIVQGTAVAFVNVPSIAIAVDIVENLDDAFSLFQATTAMGFVIAPLFGSLLYLLYGFKTVMLILAVFPLIALTAFVSCLVFGNIEIPDAANSEAEEGSSTWTPSLWRLDILVLFFTVVVNFSIWGFFDVSIGLHTEAVLSISRGMVGIVFAIGSSVYAISAAAASTFTKKFGDLPVMTGAWILSAIGLTMLGPSPFLAFMFDNRDAAWITTAFATVILSAGQGISVVPCLPIMRRVFENAEPEKDFAELLSSLFNCAMMLGSSVGPLLSGILLHRLPHEHEISCDSTLCSSGFQWTSFVFALTCLCCAFVLPFTLKNIPKQSDT